MNLKMSGHYLCRVYRADGSLREELAFDNVITDAGLDRYGYNYGGNAFGYGMVGIGTATPSFTDTTLANKLVHTSTHVNGSVVYVAGAPDYLSHIVTYRFAPGSINNQAITEVGVGWSTTEVFSRALILDAYGEPTSLTVASDEYFDLVYDFRVYPPYTDQSFVLPVTGYDDVTFTVRPKAVTSTGGNNTQPYVTKGWAFAYLSGGNASTGTIHPIYVDDGSNCTVGVHSMDARNAAWVSTWEDVSSNSWSLRSPYVPGSFELNWTLRIGLDTGNSGFNHINFIMFFGGIWQIHLDKTITKTNAQVLDIALVTSWGRA